MWTRSSPRAVSHDLRGIFAGFSGGACLAGAEQLLRGPLAGETVVIVLADSGMKYLSTDLWTDS